MALALTLAVIVGTAQTPWQRVPAAARLVPPAVFLGSVATRRRWRLRQRLRDPRAAPRVLGRAARLTRRPRRDGARRRCLLGSAGPRHRRARIPRHGFEDQGAVRGRLGTRRRHRSTPRRRSPLAGGRGRAARARARNGGPRTRGAACAARAAGHDRPPDRGRQPARVGPRSSARSQTAAQQPLAVGLLDLDHFKAFNDQHGHEAGDTLLTATARAWLAELRPTDRLARIGGEEFAVLLAGCEAARTTPHGLTCSGGIAQWDGIEDADALLRRADLALYRAKRSGRNRIEQATSASLELAG